MTKPIVKCRCHDIEVCSESIQDYKDVFYVCCAEDPTVWTIYGDSDAVKRSVGQMTAQHVAKKSLQGDASTSDSYSKRLADIFENPDKEFADFFYW